MPIKIKATLPGLSQAPDEWDLLFDDDVTLDLSEWSTTKSVYLVRTRCLIDYLLRQNVVPKILWPQNISAREYAGRMGLFEGTDYIYPLNQHEPQSFFPLYKIENDWTEFLYEECHRVLSLSNVPRNYINSLADAFTELANNIYYHSGEKENTGFGYVHAQAYPKGQYIHISICDLGIGVYGSYERRNKVRGRPEYEVVRDAFNELDSSLNEAPGVGHRGIGLSIVRDFIVQHNCTLWMWTGKTNVCLSKNGIFTGTNSFNFKGTLIEMKVPMYGRN